MLWGSCLGRAARDAAQMATHRAITRPTNTECGFGTERTSQLRCTGADTIRQFTGGCRSLDEETAPRESRHALRTISIRNCCRRSLDGSCGDAVAESRSKSCVAPRATEADLQSLIGPRGPIDGELPRLKAPRYRAGRSFPLAMPLLPCLDGAKRAHLLAERLVQRRARRGRARRPLRPSRIGRRRPSSRRAARHPRRSLTFMPIRGSLARPIAAILLDHDPRRSPPRAAGEPLPHRLGDLGIGAGLRAVRVDRDDRAGRRPRSRGSSC